MFAFIQLKDIEVSEQLEVIQLLKESHIITEQSSQFNEI
jgi:hypothetical protein